VQNFFNYLHYRSKELPIWLGIPTLGVFTAGPPFSWSRFVTFYLAIFFSMNYVLLFNDWGDLKKNPNEINRLCIKGNHNRIEKALLSYSLISFLISLILFAQLDKLLVILALFGFLTSSLYSHPTIHLKKSLLGSKVLHLLGGEIQFLIGYLCFSSSMLNGVLIGLFFSLIFTAGHFVHECIDIDEDHQGSIRTSATRFGTNPMMHTALTIFLFAHVYFLFIAYNNIVSWRDFCIFLLPVFIHGFFFIQSKNNKLITHEQILKYRKNYRLIYAVSTIIFIFFNTI